MIHSEIGSMQPASNARLKTQADKVSHTNSTEWEKANKIFTMVGDFFLSTGVRQIKHESSLIPPKNRSGFITVYKLLSNIVSSPYRWLSLTLKYHFYLIVCVSVYALYGKIDGSYVLETNSEQLVLAIIVTSTRSTIFQCCVLIEPKKYFCHSVFIFYDKS